MANTYTLISSVTLASEASNISFSSIPQTYTDLYIFNSLRITAAPAAAGIARCRVKVNAITTGYSNRLLYSLGNTSPASDISTDYLTFFYTAASDATANTFSNSSIYFPNYTSSTNKSISVDSVSEGNSATQGIRALSAGLLTTSSAITSLTIENADGYNFVQYSTAYLYGIKNS